jgi:hypothetical protein
MRYKIIFLLVYTFALFGIINLSFNDAKSENYTEKYNSQAANLNLHGLANGESWTHKGVTIAKYIEQGKDQNSLDIKIILKMPSKPAKLDIVLAMDTSGSMVQHYNPSNEFNRIEESDIEIASRELIRLLKTYSDSRVSIVTWDDEDESDDIMTPFYNVDNQSQHIEDELVNLYQKCNETDNTIYSIGIKRAIRKLDEDRSTDPFNTSRIIIFVTGLSEFRAEPENAFKDQTLEDLLYNATENRTYGRSTFRGYQIYPIQIGINKKFKMQYDNLSMISRITSIDQNISKVYSINNTKELADKISMILINESSKPIARDVEVTDTLYPYFEYDGCESSLINDKKGIRRSIALTGPEPLNKSITGSNLLTWQIGKMNGEDQWIATIHARLVINLPVEISDNRTTSEFQISHFEPISRIKYRWMTGTEENISLFDPTIQIVS